MYVVDNGLGGSSAAEIAGLRGIYVYDYRQTSSGVSILGVDTPDLRLYQYLTLHPNDVCTACVYTVVRIYNMSFANILNPLDRVNLLISQWQSDDRMSAVMLELLRLVQTELVSVLAEIERASNPDTANGWFLDLLGERVGVYRYRVSDNTGKFGFEITDGSETDGRVNFRGRMHSSNPFLGGASRIGDAYFRRVVKARYASLFGDATTKNICSALDLLFDRDGTSLCITTAPNKIQLQVISADDVFYDLVEDDIPLLIGMPLGVSYELIRRPEITLFAQDASGETQTSVVVRTDSEHAANGRNISKEFGLTSPTSDPTDIAWARDSAFMLNVEETNAPGDRYNVNIHRYTADTYESSFAIATTGQERLVGLDSNDNKLYSVEVLGRKMRVFNVSELLAVTTNTGEEFNLHSTNTNAAGVALLGGYAYVLDSVLKNVFAYELPSGSRSIGEEFDLDDSNDNPQSIFAHEGKLCVVDDDGNIYIYTRRGGIADGGMFDLDSANNNVVAGTSHEGYVYTIDYNSTTSTGKIFAYEKNNGYSNIGTIVAPADDFSNVLIVPESTHTANAKGRLFTVPRVAVLRQVHVKPSELFIDSARTDRISKYTNVQYEVSVDHKDEDDMTIAETKQDFQVTFSTVASSSTNDIEIAFNSYPDLEFDLYSRQSIAYWFSVSAPIEHIVKDSTKRFSVLIREGTLPDGQVVSTGENAIFALASSISNVYDDNTDYFGVSMNFNDTTKFASGNTYTYTIEATHEDAAMDEVAKAQFTVTIR